MPHASAEVKKILDSTGPRRPEVVLEGPSVSRVRAASKADHEEAPRSLGRRQALDDEKGGAIHGEVPGGDLQHGPWSQERRGEQVGLSITVSPDVLGEPDGGRPAPSGAAPGMKGIGPSGAPGMKGMCP